MFWLIIAGILFILGLILIIYSFKNYDDDYQIWGIVCIVVSLIVGLIWYNSSMYWIKTTERFKIGTTTDINNQLVTIEQMKNTFYNSSDNSTINIDLVNKDLSVKINDEYTKLRNEISGWNEFLADWKANYKNRFWTACYIKPPVIDSIDLNDYLNKDKNQEEK